MTLIIDAELDTEWGPDPLEDVRRTVRLAFKHADRIEVEAVKLPEAAE
jgi:hypothetical protein